MLFDVSNGKVCHLDTFTAKLHAVDAFELVGRLEV